MQLMTKIKTRMDAQRKRAKADYTMQLIEQLLEDMRQAGWRDVVSCPKDGRVFEAWKPQHPKWYICSYEGDWPDGRFYHHVNGVMFPDLPGPVMYREC